MKRWLWPLLLLSLLFGISCSDNDSECMVKNEIADLKCPVSPICGKKDDIVGKWKLVKAQSKRPIEPSKIDYSCEEIIYEFRTDKILVISSNIDRHFDGEHEYWYLPPPYDCIISNNAYIDDMPFNFQVSESIMTMGAYFFVDTPMPENPYPRYSYTLVRIDK